jgi:lipid-A-disaccharide synthase
MPRRVFISVAEASGDQHAAQLVHELRKMDPDIIVEGLGGRAMADAGVMIHHDTVERAAMGLNGAFRYPELRRVLRWSTKHFHDHLPDLLICIDSWFSNWHLAKLARGLGVPVMYYIAPQMWASRPGRVKRLRQYVDRVACILPYEVQFFRDRQVEATFVGHPLFDTLPPAHPEDLAARFPNRPPVIGLVPGSRSSVVKVNFRNMLEVADRVLAAFPEATFLIPTMPVTHGLVQKALRARASSYPAAAAPVDSGLERIGPFTFGPNRFDELVRQCDLCITVSGTATLHVAGHGVPMIVVYRLNPFIWHLAARWIVKTRTYSLVNLLNSGRQNIVPEFIPWYGSNVPVADKVLEYLRNPQLLMDQRDRLLQLIRGLHKPGASRNAAVLAMELMTARATTMLPSPSEQRARSEDSLRHGGMPT